MLSSDPAPAGAAVASAAAAIAVSLVIFVIAVLIAFVRLARDNGTINDADDNRIPTRPTPANSYCRDCGERHAEKQKAGARPTFPLPRHCASTSVVAARTTPLDKALVNKSLTPGRTPRPGRAIGKPRAIPGKVRSGFPSGIAQKQILRAVRRFRETMN